MLNSKMLGSLWQYYRDEPALGNIEHINDFPNDNNSSNPFKFKQQITRKIGKGDTKGVNILVPLKYLSNFWIGLEIPLINYEISLQSTCSKKKCYSS